MSTRSHVGYRNQDGNIQAVYSHFDGYPSNMVPALTSYISGVGISQFKKDIRKAQRTGGIRSWDCNGPEFYDEPSDDDGWKTTEREHLNNDYAYIFDSVDGILVEMYESGTQLTLDQIQTIIQEDC